MPGIGIDRASLQRRGGVWHLRQEHLAAFVGGGPLSVVPFDLSTPSRTAFGSRRGGAH